MTTPALFATYLHNAMRARRMPPEELEHELVGVRREVITSWLDGSSAPALSLVPAIARALRREPVEVASALMIEHLPELHEPLYADVLKRRASPFAAPGDLTIRARKPRKADARETIDVGDPHDVGRLALMDMTARPEPATRKRPCRRRKQVG